MEKLTENERLYFAALDAIRKLFSDTSVSARECRDNLKALIDETDLLLSSLKEDGECGRN